ncbi:MAG: class I SAM-dependent methyltransferase [Planctomycetota bacterium]
MAIRPTMYFVHSDRDLLLQCAPKGGRAAELGVYTGDHAETMLRTLECRELHLIDYWRFRVRDHVPFEDVPAHFAELVAVTKAYMGDDPDAKLEACHRQTVARFAADRRVVVHREPTSAAVSRFADGHFDLIYVDANHQYEGVMRDLLEYAPKLARGGLLFLNDHYDAPEGRRQNLGIVGAAAAFVKRTDFRYVALNAAPWSDLVLTNDPDGAACRHFTANLLQRNVPIVELPDQLVPNFAHKLVATSDGKSKLLPSF